VSGRQTRVNLLAIDTTEAGCSAALLVDGGLTERFEHAPRRHSELLLPMMDELLGEAGVALTELDALAFARGPGSFTGIRIATAVVQGAAFGAGLPVVPVSSLQALAQGVARTTDASAVCVALDARMHEVYYAAYRCTDHRVDGVIVEERVCPPDAVPVPDVPGWHAAGSGWRAYGDRLASRCGDPVAIHADRQIRAGDVALLAARLYRSGAGVSADQALPIYLRDQVAWAKP
jgi:tRNA threonylcarbamoyladenosine biosynthesis protein TsaB